MKKIIFVLVLILGLSFYFVTNANEVCNDFYDTINDKFLNKDYLGEDEYIYNTFVLAQKESNKVRDGIVGDIVSGKINIGDSNKIKVLYNNVLDYEERNRVSTSTLDWYIDKVMTSNNIDELINNGIMIEKELGIDIFTRVVIDKDFLDNTKNIVYLYPVSFAFGSTVDYYIDEDYMAYKAYIKRAIINLLEEYGVSKNEARLVSSEVVSFYTDISNSSKLSDSYEDVTSYYNVVDREYISNVYNKFDMIKYLSDKEIKTFEYSLVDEGQYKKINEYLTDEYLMIWKKVIFVKILSSYANYLDLGYRDIVIDLNNSLTGIDSSNELEEDAVNLVNSVFSNDVDEIYSSKVISEADIEYLNDLFNDIKKQFKNILENNKWLSKETKEKALEKLEAMKVYVGNYNNGVSDIEIEVSGNSLVENIISINKSSYLREIDKLNNNMDIKALNDSEVNAYYSPMSNAVYIPSSVMFLFDSEDKYYEKLGTIGMVIAHEVTHGFDYNGSMFDSDGNLSNWWNDDDRDNFAKLKDQVSKYYSEIEVLDGKYIDGDKTVNENIADMGALKIITGVAISNKASDDDLKTMYSSFAKFWKSQATEDYTKLLLLNDSHSPNKYRVNAVLSLIDEFYDVYKVFPWNEMYVSDNKRISVW